MYIALEFQKIADSRTNSSPRMDSNSSVSKRYFSHDKIASNRHIQPPTIQNVKG